MFEVLEFVIVTREGDEQLGMIEEIKCDGHYLVSLFADQASVEVAGNDIRPLRPDEFDAKLDEWEAAHRCHLNHPVFRDPEKDIVGLLV